MSLLLALVLLVHGSIHIGYICSKSWPFEATDPWSVTALGASPEVAQTLGTALVLVTFFSFLFAAAATVGLFPRRTWRALVGVGAVASVVMLVMFITPWTLPGIAVDGILLWAAFGQGWTPARLRHAAA